MKNTPELFSPHTEADLCGGEAVGQALFQGSNFTLHRWSRRQSGWAPAMSAFSPELCKASPAQPSMSVLGRQIQEEQSSSKTSFSPCASEKI